MNRFYIGVDVGSGSARAGLFDLSGKKRAQSVSSIKQFRPRSDCVEQSSSDIWAQVCHVVRAVIMDSGVDFGDIRAIGFDATCSLVAIDSSNHQFLFLHQVLMIRTLLCGWIIAQFLKLKK